MIVDPLGPYFKGALTDSCKDHHIHRPGDYQASMGTIDTSIDSNSLSVLCN